MQRLRRAPLVLIFLVFAAAATAAAAGDFPAKGKTISFIVPSPPGGSNDVSARILADAMEKELGVPVQVVNKPGAAMQVGIGELVRAKPDGYTIGQTPLPTTITIYLNTERQARFARKDLQHVAMHVMDPQLLAVRAESPYKTAREVIEAAKATPGKIKGAAVGILGPEHLTMLQVEQIAKVRFATVQFDGAPPAVAALLGGHVDFQFGSLGVFASAFKANRVRFLAVIGKEESPHVPGVRTLESQGYKVYSYVSRPVSAPPGTPKPIVDALAGAIRTAIASEEHTKRILSMGMTPRYMGPAQTAEHWDEVEAQVKPLMALGRD